LGYTNGKAKTLEKKAAPRAASRRLTEQIADALMDALQPHGVGVVIEARHSCMMMRGVEKQNSSTVTSALRGSFRDCPMTRAEFLNLVHRSY
jgi:GTP cyclohydrolase I